METVGLIGFGVMGSEAGKKILEAGYPLHVYDVTPSTIDKAAAMGAIPTASIADLAKTCMVVLMFLPGPIQVIDCVSGENGLLHSASPGAVIVDHSTIDPGTTEAMAAMAMKKKVGYLDAPVLGRPSAVGHWALPVGGENEAIERCRPVLETFSGSIIPVGKSGTGNKIKLLNQLMFSAINAMTAEMMAIADHVGISPNLLYKTIIDSQAGTVSNLFKELGRNIVQENYHQPTFSVDLLCKDVGLAVRMAHENGAPPILGQLIQTINEMARTQGFGPQDTSAMWQAYSPIWDKNPKSV
ncbi:NAD(P)-dependent oxidoreductase [uncultured Desulfosarcina sp.]|uniref:NAD(P)-dependent oxidoreductase n=1 Tax=uncultured Desulfosarcina sp. TaxID=218289 RepID=UPI0029C7F194|nr:NAD(P)-dependent oxidoreductase [uncultured Desulfosarcina sp.]